MPASPKTFVLVHGAWGGAWIWRDVATLLRGRGHRVITPTLTGVGERVHLAGPHVNLTLHTEDVLNCLKFEEVEGKGITLVGHSYAGAVISMVAEKAPAGTIGSIVFLDASYPADGETMASYRRVTYKPGDEFLPPPVPEDARVEERAKRIRSFRLYRPQPINTYLEPLKITGARERVPKKTYIAALRSEMKDYPAIAALKHNPDWTWREVDCGHGIHVVRPEITADLLEEAGGV